MLGKPAVRASPPQLLRPLHTLKGNTALWGFFEEKHGHICQETLHVYCCFPLMFLIVWIHF